MRAISLDGLAELLETPPGWEQQAERINNIPAVIDALNGFRSLPASELASNVELGFGNLVSQVAANLGRNVQPRRETKVGIGGNLARANYNYISFTDIYAVRMDGRPVIATEIKRKVMFPLGHVWYQSSRGAQLLAALYNYHCPTFLLTQEHWKLFVENDDRNQVFTFPFDDSLPLNERSVITEMVGSSLVRAIVIILLSKICTPVEGKRLATPKKIVAIKSKRLTPHKGSDEAGPSKRPLPCDASEPNLRRKSSRIEKMAKKPTYFSGYRHGNPVYLPIRIMSAEEIEEKLL